MPILTPFILSTIKDLRYAESQLEITGVDKDDWSEKEFYALFRQALANDTQVRRLIFMGDRLASNDVKLIMANLPSGEYELSLQAISLEVAQALTEGNFTAHVILTSLRFDRLSEAVLKQLTTKHWLGWYAPSITLNDIYFAKMLMGCYAYLVSEIVLGEGMRSIVTMEDVLNAYKAVSTDVRHMSPPSLVIEDFARDALESQRAFVRTLKFTTIYHLVLRNTKRAHTIRTIMSAIDGSQVDRIDLEEMSKPAIDELVALLPNDKVYYLRVREEEQYVFAHLLRAIKAAYQLKPRTKAICIELTKCNIPSVEASVGELSEAMTAPLVFFYHPSEFSSSARSRLDEYSAKYVNRESHQLCKQLQQACHYNDVMRQEIIRLQHEVFTRHSTPSKPVQFALEHRVMMFNTHSQPDHVASAASSTTTAVSPVKSLLKRKPLAR